MRVLKPFPLVSALVLIAGPIAAQQAAVTEPAPTPPSAPAAAPAPKPSSLFESNTPQPGTIAEAKATNSTSDGSKKHTLVLSTVAIVVILVVLIFVL